MSFLLYTFSRLGKILESPGNDFVILENPVNWSGRSLNVLKFNFVQTMLVSSQLTCYLAHCIAISRVCCQSSKILSPKQAKVLESYGKVMLCYLNVKMLKM